jgi:hypothetical protein
MRRRRVDQKGRNPKWWDDWGGGRVLGLGFQFSVFRLRSCVLGFTLLPLQSMPTSALLDINFLSSYLT